MTPQDLGLPQSAWRPGQFEMALDIASWDATPHQLLLAPTGFGKSLTYMAIAALTGQRVVVLTSTKALQNQLTAEFGDHRDQLDEDLFRLVDVRGQSNYPCRVGEDPSLAPQLAMFFRRGAPVPSVQFAPCKRGIVCPLREDGCHYYDRIREAARSRVVCTNYDFWLHGGEKLGEVDLLVMDEAHQAPDELADFLAFKLTPDHKRMLKGRAWPGGDDRREWMAWLDWALPFAAGLMEMEQSREAGELWYQLTRMKELLGQGEWVIEHQPEKRQVAFDCINPESYGREWLWGRAKRTLLVSATVNVQTAIQLGMDKAAVKVWEAKSAFPISRRPVYPINNAVRLNYRSSEGEKRMWVALIDRIVDQRADRKGILHTTSFERANYFAQHSRHKAMLKLNDSRSTTTTVAQFLSTSQPGLLVSPSLTTGWDFPLSACEYQIIGKIPFPDLRSKASKTRAQRNKEWTGYTAAQVIVQASGRGMRSVDDQCETFIADGNFDWWWGQNKQHLPKWWKDAVQWVDLTKLPAPPPKLVPRNTTCHGVTAQV